MSRRYTNEDIGQILQQAELLKEEGVSKEELMEIAAEVGIGEDLLQRAQEKWLNQQKGGANYANSSNSRQAGYGLGFKLHVIPYIFASVFLVLLNMTTSRYFWCVYPILGWGLGVAIHGSCISEINNKNQRQFNPSK